MKQSAYPVRMPDALAQQVVPAAQQALVLLLLRRRHVHDAGNLVFSTIERHQYPDQAFGVGSVSLHPPASSAYLDACRIEHQVLDPFRNQGSMYPEAVKPSPVASAN